MAGGAVRLDGQAGQGSVQGAVQHQITNCSLIANTARGVGAQGGAVAIYGAALSVQDSTLQGNLVAPEAPSAATGGSGIVTVFLPSLGGDQVSGAGGSVYAWVSAVSVSGSSVTGNAAQYGAGAYVSGQGSSLYSSNTVWARNSATGTGGALMGGNSSTVAVSGSVFEANSARIGGAAYVTGLAAFTDTVAAMNNATYGGVFGVQSDASNISVALQNFTATGNSASVAGGVAFSQGAAPLPPCVASGGGSACVLIGNGALVYGPAFASEVSSAVASIGLQADNPAGVLDSGSNLSTLVLRLYDGTAPQHH